MLIQSLNYCIYSHIYVKGTIFFAVEKEHDYHYNYYYNKYYFNSDNVVINRI